MMWWRKRIHALLLVHLSGALLLLGSVGCGGVANVTPPHGTLGTADAHLIVPPIITLDQVVSAQVWRNMNEVGGTACASAPDWKVESPCPPDLSQEPPDARATTKIYAALRNPSHDGFVAYFITYHSPHNGSCSELARDLGADLGGPPDCTAAGTCEVGLDCITVSTPDDVKAGDVVFATIAPATARSIRLTFRSGRTAEYALDGPLYPGQPDRRIFMVDIGRERLSFQPGHAWVELTF
jgi:hypothetical protein